ncbi:MAG: pyridoxine 5'-phosphate synthase, partial [Pseudomonadota bacterium]|nr:pyridoxine 5'-phosphate synthase [Pseudomonadota bacterium]
MYSPSSRLSVNLNKVALLRNSRHTGVPDVLHFATLARDAGADGITVHPRPDERHIRRDDVFGLAELMRSWRPDFELNIEGYPDERLLGIVRT